MPFSTLRKWQAELHALGNIPMVIVVYLPRLFVTMLIVVVAQFCRLGAWLIDETSDIVRQPKINKRILIVTDYLPPQTHGIAIRFQQYITHMRAQGHEVHVFATTQRPELETSFDHPRLPSVVNPWNVKNRMAYNAGGRLAWTLGARQWDVVHVVFPSLIGAFVIAVCGWRRIPVYCSHHVDVDFYAARYTRFVPLRTFGLFVYNLLARWPCERGATVNAAPTLQFLRSHIARDPTRERRIPTGVAHEKFSPRSPDHRTADRRALLERIGVPSAAEKAGSPSDPAIWLLVQRLAPEKDTGLVFGALELALRQAGVPLASGGGGVPGSKRRARGGRSAEPEAAAAAAGALSTCGMPVQVVIAGDGPSMGALQAEARSRGLPVTFLGSVEHDNLPALYRGASVFVTCSTSETYGLTVVEALASGTPVVMPHCEVFDELWKATLPPAWMYDPAPAVASASDTDPASASASARLLAAMQAASAPSASAWLEANPVKVSWQAATAELLLQYEEAILVNMPWRREKSANHVALRHSLLAALAFVCTWVLVRAYSRYLIHLFARVMFLDVHIRN